MFRLTPSFAAPHCFRRCRPRFAPRVGMRLLVDRALSRAFDGSGGRRVDFLFLSPSCVRLAARKGTSSTEHLLTDVFISLFLFLICRSSGSLLRFHGCHVRSRLLLYVTRNSALPPRFAPLAATPEPMPSPTPDLKRIRALVFFFLIVFMLAGEWAREGGERNKQ